MGDKLLEMNKRFCSRLSLYKTASVSTNDTAWLLRVAMKATRFRESRKEERRLLLAVKRAARDCCKYRGTGVAAGCVDDLIGALEHWEKRNV